LKVLLHCIKTNTVLPSNRCKGIDYDLLLVKQKRKISDQFPLLKSTAKGDRALWNSLPDALQRFVTKQKLLTKNNCIKKFN